jgi:zinc protease
MTTILNKPRIANDLMMRILLVGIVIALMLMTCSISRGQQPDRSKPPEIGPPPSLKLPAIQHLKLSNGLPIVLMEKHQVPLVQMELLVKTGSAEDPKDESGLASMTAAMMEEGAGKRNALELADAIDYLGADISAYAGQHTTEVVVHTPLSKLDSALALFGDIALRPTFPSEELERNRKERLTTLQQWHDEPRAIASIIFGRTLYGTSFPYGIPTIGNEKSIRGMTVSELKKFHDKYFHPNNATLVVVGDVTAKSILPKLEKTFGEWKKGKVQQPSFPQPEQVQQRGIYIVDKPGAAQSEIRIGRIGVPRVTEDYFPIIVMNTILGGSFTSRLNQNLRETHGYTYGAGSVFDFRMLPGPFIAYAGVQTAVTDSSLIEFMKELNGILQPIPDNEVTRAKNYLAFRYPENFETVERIAGQLADLVTYDLPDDYFNNYTKNVMAVTQADVERVAKKYIDPNTMDIIIVGDEKEIGPKIAALNLGPIHNLTVDEVLGPAPVLDEK